MSTAHFWPFTDTRTSHRKRILFSEAKKRSPKFLDLELNGNLRNDLSDLDDLQKTRTCYNFDFIIERRKCFAIFPQSKTRENVAYRTWNWENVFNYFKLDVKKMRFNHLWLEKKICFVKQNYFVIVKSM